MKKVGSREASYSRQDNTIIKQRDNNIKLRLECMRLLLREIIITNGDWCVYAKITQGDYNKNQD